MKHNTTLLGCSGWYQVLTVIAKVFGAVVGALKYGFYGVLGGFYMVVIKPRPPNVYSPYTPSIKKSILAEFPIQQRCLIVQCIVDAGLVTCQGLIRLEQGCHVLGD